MNDNDLIDSFAKNPKLLEWQTKMIRKFLRLRTRVRLGRQKKIKPLFNKHRIKMLGYQSNFIVIDEFVTADKEVANEQNTSEYMEYDKFIKDAEPCKDISDLYPETIFKRPCSNCENEDSINICDQCCFRYDSWFKKKEGESE